MTDTATDAVVVPISAAQTDRPFQLRDIQVGKTDSRGLKVTQIYAVQTGDYAIYKAGEVMVQVADDTVRAQALKKSILPLSSARAEINMLLGGLPCREIGDRQLAYALQLALARLRGFAVRKQYFWRRAPDTSLIFRADILPHSRKPL
jgi:hypothetical protein